MGIDILSTPIVHLTPYELNSLHLRGNFHELSSETQFFLNCPQKSADISQNRDFLIFDKGLKRINYQF